MNSFKHRSYQKELLDSRNIPFVDIKQNMKELNTINTMLGGHGITISGVREIILAAQKIKKNLITTICEIGCGGGDNLDAINKWAIKNNIVVDFIGIDIKQECIDFAKQQYPHLPAKWVTSAYQNVKFDGKPHIIFSSLFCHHFTNEELIEQLQWLKQNATTGFFINDLHRNKIAYYSIKIITSILSKSYLVKNDAPVSVARGFIKKEWKYLLQKANIKNGTVKWKWAFRHLIIVLNHE
jgi:2-polyprenyl-3-methyl-5-hydroxy-6-metoxy-1,4-benzoquinol methylase